MGKYDKIIGSLPNLPVEDPKAQEIVDKIKAEIKSQVVHTPVSLAREYEKTRFGTVGPNGVVNLEKEFKDTLFDLLGVEGLKDLKAELQKTLTAYEQLIVESCDEDQPGWGEYGAGPTTVKLPGGESLAVQYEPTGKVEDKEAFRLWCIENGYENALQLWPSTMNAITKERLLAGESAPVGVRAYALAKIVWRKG